MIPIAVTTTSSSACESSCKLTDVGGAALDDVAGGVIFVPGEGQILNVAVQIVPDALDVALGAPGQLEPLAIAAHAPQQGRQQDGGSGPPQGPQGLGLQSRPVQPGHQEPGQFGRFGPQDGVHGQADDLGRQGVEHHGQARAQQRRRKVLVRRGVDNYVIPEDGETVIY